MRAEDEEFYPNDEESKEAVEFYERDFGESPDGK